MWSSCWMSIGDAHTQSSQAYNRYDNKRCKAQHKQYMIWQYELCTTQANMIWYEYDALHKVNERELERQWITTQTPRFVSRFEHLALHPRLHHRVGFPLSHLPPREPLPKRISYNSRSTELLSQYNNLHRGQQQPTTTPLPKRLTTNTITSHLRDTTQSPDHLYRRGIHK